MRHGIDCVGNLVGEDLAQLAFESPDLEFVAILFFDGEVLGFELAAEQEEEVVEESRQPDAAWSCGFAVEAERAFGDLRDSCEFFVGHLQVGGDLFGGAGAGEVDCVGDGFERVVDLVGDAGGEASGGGELFGTAKGLFDAEAAGGFGLGGESLLLQEGDVAVYCSVGMMLVFSAQRSRKGWV